MTDFKPCKCLNLPQNQMEYQFPIPVIKTEFVTPEQTSNKKKIPVLTKFGKTEWHEKTFIKETLKIQHPLSGIDYSILKKDAVDQKYVLVVNLSKKTAFPVLKDVFEEKYSIEYLQKPKKPQKKQEKELPVKNSQKKLSAKHKANTKGNSKSKSKK